MNHCIRFFTVKISWSNVNVFTLKILSHSFDFHSMIIEFSRIVEDRWAFVQFWSKYFFFHFENSICCIVTLQGNPQSISLGKLLYLYRTWDWREWLYILSNNVYIYIYMIYNSPRRWETAQSSWKVLPLSVYIDRDAMLRIEIKYCETCTESTRDGMV